MSNPTKFEVVLIWSHQPCPVSTEGPVELYFDDSKHARQYAAFNRVFDAYPSDDELALVVSDKNAEIVASNPKVVDPQFHRMELRTVETQDIDLTDIVNAYNETHYPEPDRGCDDGDQDDGC